ncbi:MAG: hypothetical protein AAGA15_06160 [Pseudomonadota bacterium]
MLLWYAIYCALVIIPFWQLLPRFGLPPWAALLAAFPILAILLLWLMAFGDKIGFGGRK